MGRYADFILDFLAQFAGGRGGAENELARFGLAAGFWAVLLIVTLGRLREEERPHERWLAYGFALGLLRETFMFIVEGLDILGVVSKDSMHPFFPPLEHALSMAAVIVVAGAFLRYLLEDEVLARRYIKIGLAVTAFDYLATFWWWYLFITANPSFKFGQTWADWLFRVTASVLFAYPLLLFYKRRIPGWVRTTVLVAFSFFFLCEFLMLFNLASGEVYKEIYNPIRHSLHILAIPLLGNVYYLEAKERSKRARKELRESRDFIKSVFDSVHDAISVIDVKTQKLLSVNRAFLESVKMEEHEVLGRPCYEITHRRTSPCEPPDDTCPLKETAVTGGLAVAEHIHYDRDGNRHYVEVTTVPLPSGNGTVEQVIHTARDITERKKAEEEVRRSHERLEKAYTELFGLERLKSDIIANVTHELRTPVTICGTSLELLRDAASEEERKEILSMAEDALKRLNTMVENLVSIGEVHRGELRLNIKDVNVKEAVSAAVQSLADAALKRRVTINDRLPPDLPKVRADGRALKMVLRNIIGNSIKFSKDTGGWVKIDAVREEGHLRLSISDNGIGMEEDKLQKIFQPLYQIDPTSTRAYGGMGMGLAVAESLITAMKGRIWAESQIGKGTTIHLTLPISN